ncbi:MAG: glycosyl hydrolase family 28 protein [Ferruginibacter sp.]
MKSYKSILMGLTLCVFLLHGAAAQMITKSITEFGAKPEAGFINTTAIQQAIDAVSAAGGGTVLVPSGIFVTGSIELKSDVNLHLQDGAVIKGSDIRKDYEGKIKPALIVAARQHNISITGKGIIDGNGRALMKDIFKRLEEGTLTDPAWKLTRPGEGTRTNLTYFEDCNDINVTGVTFKDATSWVTHYERCRNITIDSMRLESVAYWNNDGIDIVDCKNMRITNSYINAADDAICLKSARRDDFCDSIYIDNCTLRSSANAFKLGTGSIGGFKNITMSNIKVFDTYRSAIALEAVDGGFLENIDIRNVVATNTGNAILIRLGHRNKDDVFSTVKNIYIANVKVLIPEHKPDAGYETEGPLLMYPPDFKLVEGKYISVSPWNYKEKMPGVKLYGHNVFPSSITGLPDHAVENVMLENIEITYLTKADKNVNYFPLDSFNVITEATKDYPEFSMFGEVPVWGLYVRHVTGLTLKNITVKMEGSDYRSALLMNDVVDVSVDKLKVTGKLTEPVLVFNKVKLLKFRKIKVPGKKQHAVKIIDVQ